MPQLIEHVAQEPVISLYHAMFTLASDIVTRPHMFGYGLNDQIIRAYDWPIDK